MTYRRATTVQAVDPSSAHAASAAAMFVFHPFWPPSTLVPLVLASPPASPAVGLATCTALMQTGIVTTLDASVAMGKWFGGLCCHTLS
jgi:hypothetical protein